MVKKAKKTVKTTKDVSAAKAELTKKKVQEKRKKVEEVSDTSSEEESDAMDSSSEESSESEKPTVSSKPKKGKVNGTVAKKKESSSEESSEDEEMTDVKATIKVDKKESSSEESSSEEGSSEDSSEEESSEKEEAKAKPAVKEKQAKEVKKPVGKKESSEEEDSSEEESSDEEMPDVKTTSKAKVKATEESESSEEESSGDEEAKDVVSGGQQKRKAAEAEESSSEEDESEEEEKTEVVAEPKAPTSKKPKIASDATHGVTIGNIPFRISEEEVKEFFSDCGTVTEVKLLTNPDGRMSGKGQVIFDSAEAVSAAVEKNRSEMGGRSVFVDAGISAASNQSTNGLYKLLVDGVKGVVLGTDETSRTIFLKGFDNQNYAVNDTYDEIRAAFEQCGEIVRISLPKDYESGALKGFGYIEFASAEGKIAALELNGSECAGGVLTVDGSVQPRGDGGGRGRGHGRRDFGGRGGRFGGGRGGRGRGGRGRGRDSGGRPKFRIDTAASSGKRTTFDD